MKRALEGAKGSSPGWSAAEPWVRKTTTPSPGRDGISLLGVVALGLGAWRSHVALFGLRFLVVPNYPALKHWALHLSSRCTGLTAAKEIYSVSQVRLTGR